MIANSATTQRQLVIDDLAAHPRSSCAEIARRIGEERPAVRDHLQRLRVLHLAYTQGQGRAARWLLVADSSSSPPAVPPDPASAMDPCVGSAQAGGGDEFLLSRIDELEAEREVLTQELALVDEALGIIGIPAHLDRGFRLGVLVGTMLQTQALVRAVLQTQAQKQP